MNLVQKTLSDLAGVNYILTRFDKSSNSVPDDLDILVKPANFQPTVDLLLAKGYVATSHDKAFGGRLRGMQINLARMDRIKIDLHQDFTWRKSRYLDLNLVWDQQSQIDQFLVLINTIFEKTYLLKPEYAFLKSFIPTPLFLAQTDTYGWRRSYTLFLKWWSKQSTLDYRSPVFLPVRLVLQSYLDKFEPISLAYYLFFRTRYAFIKKLPYDQPVWAN